MPFLSMSAQLLIVPSLRVTRVDVGDQIGLGELHRLRALQRGADAEHADLALVGLQVGDEGAEARLDDLELGVELLGELLRRGRHRCPRSGRSSDCGTRSSSRADTGTPAASWTSSPRTDATAAAAPRPGDGSIRRAAKQQRCGLHQPCRQHGRHDISPSVRFQSSNCCEEARGALGRGCGEEARGGASSTISPRSMKTTRRADLARETHLVRDDEHRHALRRELAHDGQHLAPQLGIERGGRLVEQHDLRLHGERACDGDALLLAAGQPRRIDVALVGQADLGEQRLGDARPPRRAAGRAPASAPRSRSAARSCAARD